MLCMRINPIQWTRSTLHICNAEPLHGKDKDMYTFQAMQVSRRDASDLKRWAWVYGTWESLHETMVAQSTGKPGRHFQLRPMSHSIVVRGWAPRSKPGDTSTRRIANPSDQAPQLLASTQPVIIIHNWSVASVGLLQEVGLRKHQSQVSGLCSPQAPRGRTLIRYAFGKTN